MEMHGHQTSLRVNGLNARGVEAVLPFVTQLAGSIYLDALDTSGCYSAHVTIANIYNGSSLE